MMKRILSALVISLFAGCSFIGTTLETIQPRRYDSNLSRPVWGPGNDSLFFVVRKDPKVCKRCRTEGLEQLLGMYTVGCGRDTKRPYIFQLIKLDIKTKRGRTKYVLCPNVLIEKETYDIRASDIILKPEEIPEAVYGEIEKSIDEWSRGTFARDYNAEIRSPDKTISVKLDENGVYVFYDQARNIIQKVGFNEIGWRLFPETVAFSRDNSHFATTGKEGIFILDILEKKRYTRLSIKNIQE